MRSSALSYIEKLLTIKALRNWSLSLKAVMFIERSSPAIELSTPFYSNKIRCLITKPGLEHVVIKKNTCAWKRKKMVARNIPFGPSQSYCNKGLYSLLLVA